MEKGVLQGFLKSLANYYKRYSNVWTPYGSAQPISLVYVSTGLQKPDQPDATGVTNIDPLLADFKRDETLDMLLLKGDPGTGKSSLVKMIAYEWAQTYLSVKCVENKFAAVFCLPLRLATKCQDFLSMTVEYYIKHLKLQDLAVSDIVKGLEQLGPEVLICLDGLDELNNVETQMMNMFTTASNQEAFSSQTGIPTWSSNYKLIVTSRPYACKTVRTGLRLRTYTMAPLSILQLTDRGENIPQNRSAVYDRCLYHMMKKAVKEHKVVEDKGLVNDWITTNLAHRTADLALAGCQRNTIECDATMLAANNVPNDSFACGFLLHQSDDECSRQSGLFPHRSIQEYFAALKCYFLAIEGKREASDYVLDLMYRYDEISTFLFGIASNEHKFNEVVNSIRMNNVFESVRLNMLLQTISTSDFTQEEIDILADRVVGQKENRMLGMTDKFKWLGWDFFFNLAIPVIISFRDRHKQIGHKSIDDFVEISSVDDVMNLLEELFKPNPNVPDSSEPDSMRTATQTILGIAAYANDIRTPTPTTNLLNLVSKLFLTNPNGLTGETNRLASSIRAILEIAVRVKDMLTPTEWPQNRVFCRLTEKGLEAFGSPLDNPRFSEIAGSIGPLSTIWRDKLDTIANFILILDEAEFTDWPTQLNSLPNGTRNLNLAFPTVNSKMKYAVVRCYLQYDNQLPKPLKFVAFYFDRFGPIVHTGQSPLFSYRLSKENETITGYEVKVKAECDMVDLVVDLYKMALKEKRFQSGLAEETLD